MSETDLLHRLMLRASELNHRLFRSNSGQAWTGTKIEQAHRPRTVVIDKGDVVIRHARPIKFGFVGMSDLFGWKALKITQEMVGKTIAQFMVIEGKMRPRKATKEQLAFIDVVNKAGGIGKVCYEVTELPE